MTTRGLLPIGQFAQACGLTVIALRHYDATGVLPPALVDPSSGYRYYAREQVPTAQLVRLLRQVDVPVDELPKLLARIQAGDDVLPDLSALLDRRTSSAWTALEQLRLRLSGEGGTLEDRVRVRTQNETAFLMTSAELILGEGPEFGRTAYEMLYAAAGRGPLTLRGPAFVRYHGMMNDTERVRVDACLPYWLGAAEPRDLPDGITAERHPGGRFASLEVCGPESAFPAISAGYDAVAEWIAKHDFDFDGLPHEVYRRWRGEEGHPDNILEVGWWITG